MSEPDTYEVRSNDVLWDEDGPQPPEQAILEARQWLKGKLGSYPCMDCCPNIFIKQDTETGDWLADVHHDETCPDLTGVV